MLSTIVRFGGLSIVIFNFIHDSVIMRKYMEGKSHKPYYNATTAKWKGAISKGKMNSFTQMYVSDQFMVTCAIYIG